MSPEQPDLFMNDDPPPPPPRKPARKPRGKRVAEAAEATPPEPTAAETPATRAPRKRRASKASAEHPATPEPAATPAIAATPEAEVAPTTELPTADTPATMPAAPAPPPAAPLALEAEPAPPSTAEHQEAAAEPALALSPVEAPRPEPEAALPPTPTSAEPTPTPEPEPAPEPVPTPATNTEPTAAPAQPTATARVLQAGRETRVLPWAPPLQGDAARFAVLIPNWNGAAFIERCLGSVYAALRQAGLAGAAVLVHDDASDDDSVARIEASFPQVRLVKSTDNVGFGESVNRLMRATSAEWVYLLNNDLALASDFCARLRETMEAMPAATTTAAEAPAKLAATRPLLRPPQRAQGSAVAGAAITSIAPRRAAVHAGQAPLFAIGALTRDWATHEANHGGQRAVWRDGLLAQEPFDCEKAAEAGYFQAGACLIHRARFLALGGFPALFHPGYWEDYDLSWAARARGWRVLYEPRAVAYHCGKGSMRRRYGEFGVSLMLRRNHLLFTWVNLHDRDLLLRHMLALPGLVWRGSGEAGQAGWGRALLAALKRLPAALRLRAQRRASAQLSCAELLGEAGPRP